MGGDWQNFRRMGGPPSPPPPGKKPWMQIKAKWWRWHAVFEQLGDIVTILYMFAYLNTLNLKNVLFPSSASSDFGTSHCYVMGGLFERTVDE